MSLQLRRAARAATDGDVDDFEASYDVRLPEDYKSFLRRTNGGRCLEGGEIVDPENQETISSVDLFLGFSDAVYEDLIKTYERMLDRLPPGMVPIASDAGGNLLLMDCASGPGYGSVYFAGMEFLDEGAGRSAMVRVGSSFGALLQFWEES